MVDRCSWIDSKGRKCPKPGTIKRGDRSLCLAHARCTSKHQGDKVTEELIDHEVPRPGEAVLDMARVARIKARKEAAREALASSIYFEAFAGCIAAGLDGDAAHRKALGEVYKRGEYSVIDPGRYRQATPFGSPEKNHKGK